MKIVLKIKNRRIQVVRPEVSIEFVKPFLGRLYFLAILPKLLMFKRVKMNVGGYRLKDGSFINLKPITILIIGIPKIKFVDAYD